MQQIEKNISKLLPSNTVDDEVNGAVDDCQVPCQHVHHHLPLRTIIGGSWRVETINHQVVPEKTDLETLVVSLCFEVVFIAEVVYIFGSFLF